MLGLHTAFNKKGDAVIGFIVPTDYGLIFQYESGVKFIQQDLGKYFILIKKERYYF